MKKKPEPTQFKITLREFLEEIPMPESRRAFGDTMQGAARKHRDEWRKLFDAWLSKPVGT